MSKKFSPLAFCNFATKTGFLNFSEPRRDFFVISNMKYSTWILKKSNFGHLTMYPVGRKEYERPERG